MSGLNRVGGTQLDTAIFIGNEAFESFIGNEAFESVPIYMAVQAARADSLVQ
jgi:hypothetical protein